MVMNRGSFAKALEGSYSTFYGVQERKHEIQYDKIFEVVPATGAFNEETGVTGFGMAVKKLPGKSITFDDSSQTFTDRYTYDTFGLGYIITREMWDDGVAMAVGLRRAKALEFSIRSVKEYLGANILNRAFNSSYVYGDGVELCSELHPNKSGGTWANELDTAADLSEAALEQAEIDIGGWTSDKGLPVAAKAMKLVVSTSDKANAYRILESTKRVNTANNDANYVGDTMGLSVVVNNYLSDTDAWFLCTDQPDGLKYMERRKNEFSPGSENDFDTENAKFKATFRGAFGATDKKGIFGSPGAT